MLLRLVSARVRLEDRTFVPGLALESIAGNVGLAGNTPAPQRPRFEVLSAQAHLCQMEAMDDRRNMEHAKVTRAQGTHA